MALFTSAREKKLWLWTLGVIMAIFSTLLIGQPFAKFLTNQDIQAAIFLLGMALVGATMVIHGLKTKPGKVEITIWLGLATVFMMTFLRLGLPERSHLIEYSVLTIFIHKALMERVSQGGQLPTPAFLAFLGAFSMGVIDESIQFFLPNRVFDPADILFNSFAALMAIGASVILNWAKKRIGKT